MAITDGILFLIISLFPLMAQLYLDICILGSRNSSRHQANGNGMAMGPYQDHAPLMGVLQR
jgi:hypothetical protein